MSDSEKEFLQRLQATFRIEAEEHLATISGLFLALEKSSEDKFRAPLIETLFREVHSLKGAARSVSRADMERVCQAMEGVLSALKRGEIQLSSSLLETIYASAELLGRLLHESESDSPDVLRHVGTMVESLDVFRRASQKKALSDNVAPAMQMPASSLSVNSEPVAQVSETVRISTAKLASVFLQAEELLSLKVSMAHMVTEMRQLLDHSVVWKKKLTKRAQTVRAIHRVQQREKSKKFPESAHASLSHLLDDVENDELSFRAFKEQLGNIIRVAEQERRSATALVDGLLDELKQALMVPFSSVFPLLQKLVRDLAKECGKDVELFFKGESIEVDRRVLEQMKDPLIHLIRNAVDHGIEMPDERLRKGKAARGAISIALTSKDGGKVELLVSDDGAGANLEKLRQQAQRLRLVLSESVDSNDSESLLNVMFESGLSTRAILTDISGHGLGLAIVRERVERLGGSVSVESKPEVGLLFRIVLPTSLAAFRGVLIAIGDRQFVLPSSHVECAIRCDKNAIKTIEGSAAIEYRGQVFALVQLADILELPQSPPSKAAPPFFFAVVLVSGSKRIAVRVDDVLADQEVLVKNLGPQLRRIRNVSAVTVLGTGRIVPILNVQDLFKSALKVGSMTIVPSTPIVDLAQQKSLLVAEDSITSRALLKNILETAGFRVDTAVDGVEALTALRCADYDLLISDVEMPRMDGFDLTAHIRADAKLAELPVVLVTALDSREDRERGIDVGANAYIVKSSFEQSNLIDAVRRLI